MYGYHLSYEVEKVIECIRLLMLRVGIEGDCMHLSVLVCLCIIYIELGTLGSKYK